MCRTISVGNKQFCESVCVSLYQDHTVLMIMALYYVLKQSSVSLIYLAKNNFAWDTVSPQVDIFVHQSKLLMRGFHGLADGEKVGLTFTKSPRAGKPNRVLGTVWCLARGTKRNMQIHIPKSRQEPWR